MSTLGWQIRRRLEPVYGDRLKGIVLYGSEARGDAEADSDIDVLVILNRVTDYGRELRANIEALYDLSQKLGRRISAKPVDAHEYETADCPLFLNARREGVAA